MTVLVKPWREGGKFQVYIGFRWPDMSRHVERKVVDAPTEAQARKWGEQRERELRGLGKPVLAKVYPTFSAFVKDEWLPTYPARAGNRATTIREKKIHLRLHLEPYFGSLRLNEIDAKTLDKFAARMARKTVGKLAALRTSRNGVLAGPRPLSAKRVRNVMATLHTILVTAVEWGTLEHLPRFPRIKTSATAFDFYNSEEAALLISSARDADERALIRFALHTGARAGEQLAFKWSDLDVRNKLVSFSKSSTDGIVTDGTKGGKPRKVPVSPALEADLGNLRHLKGPLVFCQADGSPLTLWHLHGALDRAARKSGLRRLRWHDLRHSFASNLTIGGAPIRQVQEWLGHASITMTMRYAHLAPGGGREYLSSLESCATGVQRSEAV